MKTYLIIGASSGIGAAVAKQLTNDGHRVIGTYCNTESAAEKDNFHKLDVLTDEIDWSFIPEKLDGVVYAPGAINLKPFHRLKTADFVEDLNLQVIGATKVLDASRKALLESDSPSVVLYSSVAASKGFPFHAAVSISKGAIEGLTKALSAEWAPKIRVNAVAPSLTDTPLAERLVSTPEKRQANAERHPLQRIGEVQDIASATTFLLGDQSSWMTGEVLHVDGGKSSIAS